MSAIKQTETAACEVLFVKIPDDTKTLHVDWKTLVVDMLTPKQFIIVLPDGEWGLLTNDLANITEEQAAIVVDSLPAPLSHLHRDFKDYTKPFHIAKSQYVLNTATKSLHSLTESVQAYMKNPLEEMDNEQIIKSDINWHSWKCNCGCLNGRSNANCGRCGFMRHHTCIHYGADDYKSDPLKLMNEAHANTGRWAVLFKPKSDG